MLQFVSINVYSINTVIYLIPVKGPFVDNLAAKKNELQFICCFEIFINLFGSFSQTHLTIALFSIIYISNSSTYVGDYNGR